MDVVAASHVAASEWPEAFSVEHSSIQVGNGANSDAHARITTHSFSMGNNSELSTLALVPMKSRLASMKNVDHLLEHRPYDFRIDLLKGTSPPFGPIYGLPEPELEALRTYFDENLEKGLLGTRPSLRKIKQQSVVEKNLRMRSKARYAQRKERERHKEYLYSRNATVTNNNNQQPFLKVTKSLYIVTDLGQLPFMLFT